MHLFLIGFNHKNTPSTIRDQLVIADTNIPEALRHILNIRNILGTAILSTCNRTEIYCSIEIKGAENEPLREAHKKELTDSLLHFLATFQKIDLSILQKYYYAKNCQEAVIHAFRVSASLDSLIIGERQILSQVKHAYSLALSNNSSDSLINRLFQNAITVGKKVRTETALGMGAVSVSQAAVELSLEIFENIKEKSALIIGAGEMADLAALHLQAKGVRKITFINRTTSKAQSLAEKYQTKSAEWNQLLFKIEQSDIIFSATSASEFIIHFNFIEKIVEKRKTRPLLFLDLAMPRDIDPNINNLSNVYLFSIDDLNMVVDKNQERRQKEIPKAEKIILSEFEAYYAWYSKLNILPVIRKLKDKLETMRQDTVQQYIKKNQKNKSSDIDTELLHKVTSKYLDKIIKEIMGASEKIQGEKDWVNYSNKLKDIFDIKPGDFNEPPSSR